MTTIEVEGGTVGEVSFAANAAVGLIIPMGAQIDAFIGVSLGPLQADLNAQLNGSLAAAASLGISIGNPAFSLQLALSAVARLQASLSAVVQLQASLSAALGLSASLTAALSLPTVSIQANLSLSAVLSLAAALEIKLGLLDIAIKALLRVKLAALEMAAEASGALSGGTAILVEFSGTDLATAGSEINSLFSSGVNYGGASIGPGEAAYGYVLVTKLPGTKSSFDYILRGP